MKKIATVIAKKLQNYKTAGVLFELSEYRKLREILLSNIRSMNVANDTVKRVSNNEQYLVYMAAHNLLNFIIEIVSSGLPGFEKHNDVAIPAMKEYMPSWPPNSPISKSFYNSWLSLDLSIGRDQESFTSCIVDLKQHLGVDDYFCYLFDLMNNSRLGVYKVLNQLDNTIILEELFIRTKYLCYSPQQIVLPPNTLCLMRLLPPINKKFDHNIAVESPYVLISSEEEWQTFFKKTIKGDIGTAIYEANYERFMKNGLGHFYWLEYLFQGYMGHTDLAIYTKGMPDIGASRPHFFNNSILPERK